MTILNAEAPAAPIAFVVGESLIDIVVTPTSHQKFAGGSPMNTACGLARLGMTTALRTQLGDDENGRFIQNHLLAEGVQLDPASVSSERTSTALARIQPDGHAQYMFNVTWGAAQFEPPPGVTFVHSGSIASVMAPGAADIVALFGRASPSVVHSFDPNIRPGVLTGTTEVRANIDAIAMFSNIVKMSDEDAAWMHPGADLDSMIDRYLDFGASVVAITLASEGCLIASRSARLRRRLDPVDVVDTIGAGDAFMSGMLYAVHALELKGRLLDGDMQEADLAAIAGVALESARIVVSRAGPNPPSLPELRARVGDLLPNQHSEPTG